MKRPGLAVLSFVATLLALRSARYVWDNSGEGTRVFLALLGCVFFTLFAINAYNASKREKKGESK